MSRLKPLPLAFCLFISGIVFANAIAIDLLKAALFVVLLFILFLFIRKKRSAIFFIVSAALVFFLGILSYLNCNLLPRNHVSGLLEKSEKEYFIQGVVASSPQYIWRYGGKREAGFILKALSYKSDDTWLKTEGLIKLKIKENEEDYQYGDIIVVFAKIKHPAPARNPGEFDYAQYLKRERIYVVADVKSDDDTLIIKRQGPVFIKRQIFAARQRLEALIKQHLGRQEAAILNAMLIGRRADIPRRLSEQFVETGTAHIISISGLHVALIAGILFFMLTSLRIPRNISSIFIIAFLIVYTILADARPPIVRSTIMIIVYMMGFALRRAFDIYSTLSLAGIIILMFNPMQVFDAGFILSFVCVFFISYLTPRLKFVTQNRIWGYIIRLLLASSAVTIGVLPIIAYYFNIISPISILANMFIVPISGVVLFLGLLFISLGSLFGPLAWVVGLFLQFSLAIFIKIVALFSRVPFGYFYVPDVPLFAVVMYYVLFFVILYRKRLKLTWPKIVTILLIILNIFLWRASFQKEDTLTATFLDLKNDDTVFIEFPDGKTVLVNSGIANGRFYNEADRTVVPFIFSRGRGSVDILVLTNSDSSYISSASALLKKIRVSYFISPDLTISSKHIRWVRLKNGLKIKGIAGAEILIKGQSALEIRYKDAHIIISPAKNYFYLDQRPKEGIEVGPDNETGAVKLITDGASYSIERFL